MAQYVGRPVHRCVGLYGLKRKTAKTCFGTLCRYPSGGHNDLTMRHGISYFQELSDFVRCVMIHKSFKNKNALYLPYLLLNSVISPRRIVSGLSSRTAPSPSTEALDLLLDQALDELM